MKKKVRSYLAFTTIPYRIVGLILIPALLFVFSALLLDRLESDGIFLKMQLVNYLVIYEVLTDHWFLGGCLTDHGKNLEYFRTSKVGTDVLKSALVLDLMRRFAYCMGFAVMSYGLTGQRMDFVTGLVMYCVTAGVLNGTRYIVTFMIELAVAISTPLLTMILMWVNYSLMRKAEAGYGTVVFGLLVAVYVVLALAVSLITLRHMLWQLRYAGKSGDRETSQR